DRDQSKKMVVTLSIRIGLSVFLFILMFFGYYMGWVTPNL
ncbi:DUF2909 domain-containing protein, partial [Methylophilaceae bacterium]|nr:DUF2909 domain-containing protein [Methylophilaceae bacterium]